jgi:hypothetical protein
LARSVFGRAERGGDLVVGKIEAVTEDDGRPLLRRQLVGERAELSVRGKTVLDGELRQFAAGFAAAGFVDRDPGRDREDPRTQVPAVSELRVGAERAEKRLLEGVLRTFAEQPPEVRENSVSVSFIEALERRAHVLHCLSETGLGVEV